MVDLVIRNAVYGDAERIADIYNYYVLHSVITFDTEPKSVEDRIRWMDVVVYVPVPVATIVPDSDRTSIVVEAIRPPARTRCPTATSPSNSCSRDRRPPSR